MQHIRVGWRSEAPESSAMPILHVRNVPARLYARLRRMAAGRHRSLSAEILATLEEAVEREERIRRQEAALADLDAVRAALPRLPSGVDSSDWIREDRDLGDG
jgi:plasmid stability protein